MLQSLSTPSPPPGWTIAMPIPFWDSSTEPKKTQKRMCKYDHITQTLKSLHWLPIPFRIEAHPPQTQLNLWRRTHLSKRTPYPIDLHSFGTYLLKPHGTKLCTMGDQAFCTAAPSLWNFFSDHLRALQSVDVFKRDLKTFLLK